MGKGYLPAFLMMDEVGPFYDVFNRNDTLALCLIF